MKYLCSASFFQTKRGGIAFFEVSAKPPLFVSHKQLQKLSGI
jgi:hypothetical protein